MPAHAPTSPLDLLAQLTPSEVALAFADRFLPATSEKQLWGYLVMTSGRYVNSPNLAAFMAEVVVGALVERGDAALLERPTRFLLWSRSRPALQLSAAAASGNRWPVDSPEGRVLEWLRAQRDHAAHLLRDVLAEGLIGDPNDAAHRAPLDVGLRGMARLHLTAVAHRSTMRIVRYDEVTIDQARVAVLSRASDADVTACLAGHRALSANERARIRRAWTSAAALKCPHGY